MSINCLKWSSPRAKIYPLWFSLMWFCWTPCLLVDLLMSANPITSPNHRILLISLTIFFSCFDQVLRSIIKAHWVIFLSIILSLQFTTWYPKHCHFIACVCFWDTKNDSCSGRKSKRNCLRFVGPACISLFVYLWVLKYLWNVIANMSYFLYILTSNVFLRSFSTVELVKQYSRVPSREKKSFWLQSQNGVQLKYYLQDKSHHWE